MAAVAASAAESTGIAHDGSEPSVRYERTAALDWLDSNEALLCDDISEPLLCDDSVEPSDMEEPSEKADANDPTEPSESTEPTDPIERIEPSEQIERMLPRDRTDQRARRTAPFTRQPASGRRATNTVCELSSSPAAAQSTTGSKPACSSSSSHVRSAKSPSTWWSWTTRGPWPGSWSSTA